VRKLAVLAVSLLAVSLDALAAQPPAQFPARPVRLIVANGPGSAPDVGARLLSAKLT